MKNHIFATFAALAISAAAPASAASATWALGGDAARTTLAFARPDSAAPVMRFACEPAGASLFVPTRPPRFGDTSGNPTPSNVSLIIGSTQATVSGTLSRPESGWQVVGPIPDLPRLVGALRANPRFSIIHHAGRAKATSPAEPLLAEFEKRCAAMRVTAR